MSASFRSDSKSTVFDLEETNALLCTTELSEKSSISFSYSPIVANFVRLSISETELSADPLYQEDNFSKVTPIHISDQIVVHVLLARSLGLKENDILCHLIFLKQLANLNLLRPPEIFLYKGAIYRTDKGTP